MHRGGRLNVRCTVICGCIHRRRFLLFTPHCHWLAGQGNMAELQMLRQQRDAVDDQIQRLEWSVTYGGGRGEGSADSVDEDEYADVLANLTEQVSVGFLVGNGGGSTGGAVCMCVIVEPCGLT